MHDLHVGDFFHDAARILVQLYKRFPNRTSLYIEDIIGLDQPDEFGLHSPRHMACFHAALWLAEEGYFRYNQVVQQEAFDEVVLTQPCFLFFTTPSSPEDTQSRIAKVEGIIKSRDSEALNKYLLDAFTLFSAKP